MNWTEKTINGYRVLCSVPDDLCTLYITWVPEDKLYSVQTLIEYEAEGIGCYSYIKVAMNEAKNWYKEYSQNWL